MKLGAVKERASHVFERLDEDWYTEPFWTSERLFEEETFEGPVWDPCCGSGRIPDSARAAGHEALATDLVDRGYRHLIATEDFRTSSRTARSIASNPPFNIFREIAEKALSIEAVEKIALVFPVARLNAAKWLQDTPLARVWLMTPRPSMPPGSVIARGEKPGGGKADFCWLVMDRGHVGQPELRWLHRDKDKQR